MGVTKSQTQLKQLSTDEYICIFRFFSLASYYKILNIIPCTIWQVLIGYLASLIAQLLKNPPSMRQTPARFLDWEDPPEKG